MSSSKRLIGGFAAALILGAATGCTSDGPAPAPAQTSSTPAASATNGPTAPVTARDGRTVLPTSESDACSLLSEAAIRESLGAVAQNLQAPQPSAGRLPEGTTEDFCLYPFESGGATTNAVLVEVRNYPTPQAAKDSDPFALLMNPEDLPGLREPAKYAVNSLKESTEFVVASMEGSRVVRLVAALPPAKAWDRASGKEHMKKLATAAGL